MKCGIVGLPNVGKSTLFKALTSIKVPAENYPFCTIEPNVGVVQVHDERVEKLSRIFKSKKQIYPFVEFVDIAGLVQGASQGEGLGHQFLSHIRQCQALLHVVRLFDNPDISHVLKDINPLRDIEIIESELILADIQTVQNRINKIEKLSKSDKEYLKEVHFLKKLFDFLNRGQAAHQFLVEKEEQPILYSLHLLSYKPVLYLCNIGEDGLEKSQNEIQKLKHKMGEDRLVILSGRLESDLVTLAPLEQEEFLKDLGFKKNALHRLVIQVYKLLKLMTFFTAGESETRAWTIQEKTKAPQAGGSIHSDFEKKFIRAEVYSCEDIFKHKSLSSLKEKGLYRLEGKNYEIKDGDVCFFRINA